MGEVEVKAMMPMSVSELGGMVKRGQMLRVDGDNVRIQALMQAGYLKLTKEYSDVSNSVDHAGVSGVSGDSVDSGVETLEGPKKRGRPKKVTEASNGEGEHQPGDD